ncbi:hypothetical protein O181_098623 [Austropuccinia psidii MF-1]|uniref:Uncharacterized protein n=1 Tax=Austropuccinia psidii MF-1 TaxID=1389203 RepID=A0A9Q3J9L4_9BASI|nr:hypothetical protein [Austropuccinia psidii MF-1]
MPHVCNKLTSPLDTRIALNPSITIQPEEILDIVHQISSQPSPSNIDEPSQVAQGDAYRSPPDKGKYQFERLRYDHISRKVAK